MRASQAMVQLFADVEVQQLFGLMGDANMDYIAAYIEHGRGHYVPAIDERSAVAMASGYARASGKVGVVSVTHGPGAANTIGPLVEAVRSRNPVLVLTGDTPAAQAAHAQDIDLGTLFSGTGAEYHRVKSSAALIPDLTRLLRQVSVTKLPVVCNIPVDIFGDDVEYSGARATEFSLARLVADAGALDSALGALVQSRRPLLVAGRGAVESGARESMILLAERLGAPLATTVGGKDLFIGHPYDLGIMGTLSAPWAAEVIAQADCIVSFGAGLNEFTTMRGGFVSEKTLIQCDSSAASFERWGEADFLVQGDAATTASAMVELLAEAEYEAEDPFRERVLEAADIRERSRLLVDASGVEPLSAPLAAVLIDQALPKSRVLVTDCGRFGRSVWSHLHVERARDFQHLLTWASIGLGISTAIGASVANRDRLTAAIVGDGGGMMGLIELATAVKQRLPLVVFVFNDSAYGAEYKKLADKGLDTKHSLLDLPELASIARGLGAESMRVETRAELEQVLIGLHSVDAPVLVDIQLDPAAQF